MTVRGRKRRVISASFVALAAGLLFSSSGGGVSARPSVVLRQADGEPAVSTSAAVADVAGAHPGVSGDGRFVVFEGAPPARPDGQPADPRTSTVYVTDRSTGETTELSPVPADQRPGDTVLPVISGDGCVVAAVSEMALDVFRDNDAGLRWDVYRMTLPHCEGQLGGWELVSSGQNTGGLSRDDVTLQRPTVSRSGSLIAYTHPADHLFEADGITTISLVDAAVPATDPRRTQLVAGSPADIPDNTFVHAGLDQPVISDDGRYLAYRSSATSSEAVPGWGTGPVEGEPATRQVFLWDRADADPFTAVTLLSARPDGTPSEQGAADPDLSRDGSVVVFTSSDRTLVDAEYPSCDVACPAQVFVLDRDTDDSGSPDDGDVPALALVSAVSTDRGPVAGTARSGQPAVSANGQLVAFVTEAPNLQLLEVPGVGPGDDGDVLLAELDRGALRRLTNVAGTVVPTPGVHAHPAISDSGRTVVFDTAAAEQLVDAGPEPSDDEESNDDERADISSDAGASDADAEDDSGDANADDAVDGDATVIELSGERPADPADPDDAGDADASESADPEQPDAAVDRTAGRTVVARSLPPRLSLPDADLGTTLVGVEGDEWYVAVVNDGPSSFQPSIVDVSNAQFTINAERSTCTFGGAVPAGGSCTVALTYTPSRPGAASATLTVAEEGFDGVSISSQVAGAGGEPTLRIDPAGADLGLVTVGESSVEFQFDVSNISVLATALETFEITGVHADDFEFTSNNCVDRPLNPRASCSVGVSFRPTDEGRRTALVELGTRSGQYTTMVLAGDGEFEPQLTLSSTSVDAGELLVASGVDYPANTEVTIVLGDGPTGVVTATTDENGTFVLPIPVSRLEQGGASNLVVQSENGAAATASIEIVPTEQPFVGMPGFGLGG